jgi:hypothetical protein
MKKLVSMLHSLLIGPVTFCVGLLIVLFATLVGVNRLVEVDTAGRPLVKRKCVADRHPITTEMIELTRDLGWDENPDNISKLDRLKEIHERENTEPSVEMESISLIRQIDIN